MSVHVYVHIYSGLNVLWRP